MALTQIQGTPGSELLDSNTEMTRIEVSPAASNEIAPVAPLNAEVADSSVTTLSRALEPCWSTVVKPTTLSAAAPRFDPGRTMPPARSPGRPA